MGSRLDARHGCSTRGCNGDHHAGGLCSTCYRAERRARGLDGKAPSTISRQHHHEAVKALIALARETAAQQPALSTRLWEIRDLLD